jgi:hypothetical protein
MSETSAVIDGLKLRMTGESIRTLLGQRIVAYQGRAEHWLREQARTPEEQTEEHPLLPEHMCENEAARSVWRAEVLRFIREHIDVEATYFLDRDDLEFGELLPARPGCVEQEEYEERTGIAFNLERLTKQIGVSAYALDRFRDVDDSGERATLAAPQ